APERVSEGGRVVLLDGEVAAPGHPIADQRKGEQPRRPPPHERRHGRRGPQVRRRKVEPAGGRTAVHVYVEGEELLVAAELPRHGASVPDLSPQPTPRLAARALPGLTSRQDAPSGRRGRARAGPPPGRSVSPARIGAGAASR